MYLTADSLLPYLLQRGVLRSRDLLRRQWVVASSDLKRPVLRVSTSDGAGWIVKQASPLDSRHVRMLDREAAFYRLPELLAWARPLAALMPRLRAYDAGVHALIVEQVPHDTGWNHLRRETAQSRSLGALLGRAMASIHLRIPTAAAQPLLFAAKLPWILQLNGTASDEIEQPATRALLDIIRADVTLAQRLRRLEADWRPDTLIHGDAKLDNVLVRMSARPRAWFIDWAFAGEGDPAWDLGSMMQSCLLLWLYGVAFRRDGSFDEAVAAAAFPIERVQSFTRSLLVSYRAKRCVSDDAWRNLVLRAVRCSGAALLQSALADARALDRYTPRQLAMLQIGRRILVAPRQALRDFFDVRQQRERR